jgi:shikimate kinase
MKISLIGMSGCGKSFWAEKLAASGFERFCIDDLIEQRLGDELRHHGIKGVAEWMGQPYEARHGATSARYLALEQAAVEEALDALEKQSAAADTVIDTTGSVIYLGKQLLDRLASLTTLIYLDTLDLQALYEQYVRDPKPVIWGNTFSQRPHESPEAALARCYPDLLAYRQRRYRGLAHHTLDHATRWAPGFDIGRFLRERPPA